MGRAGLLAALGAGALISLASACSVFSGWDDLQDGETGDAGNTGRRDGATGDEGPPADARVEDDAFSFDKGVQCGEVTCAFNMGCCALSKTQKHCSDPATCEAEQGVFLRCTSRAGCSLTGLDCCLGADQPLQSSCTAACPEQNKVMLCDPSEPLPCSTGVCTQNLAGTLGLMYCSN
jgi:hypothetical protein